MLKHLKKIILLMLPIAGTQLSQMAMGVVDTIMSGNASAQDLAAVAVGSSLWIPLMLFMTGILTAITPTVAHYVGAQQWLKIGHSIRQSFWIALFLGLIASLLLFSTYELFLYIHVNSLVLPIASGYLSAIAWCMPAIAGFAVLRYLHEGMANTYPVMLISFCGLAINIICNYILIFGHFGAPALGGIGAGWATTITLWSMFIILLIYTLISRKTNAIQLFNSDVKPHYQELKTLIKLGLPIGTMFFIEGSVFSVIALFLASLDVATIAAHQIALNFSSMIFLLPLSLSISLSIHIGHQVGAKQFTQIKQSLKSGYIISLSISSIAAIIIINFAPQIVHLYTQDQSVIPLASSLMMFTAIYQFSDGIQLCSAGALRGLKDTTIPMILSFISYWVIGFPLGYILALTSLITEPMGAKGFWIGLIIGLSVSAVLMSSRLYFKTASVVRKSAVSSDMVEMDK